MTLFDFITSQEDMNLNYHFANLLKIIRGIAFFITLLLPGLYLAVTIYHRELLPTELLYSIVASRVNVPFPILVEILIMELSFELIREAGLRVPSPLGSTVGIVGALVLGEAAVSANIVSPILIIIVAITAISSFAIPDFSLGFHLRISRFAYTLLGSLCGFLGIGVGIFIHLITLCSLKSFGVPYLSPYMPKTNIRNNGYLLKPVWKREKRSDFVASKGALLSSTATAMPAASVCTACAVSAPVPASREEARGDVCVIILQNCCPFMNSFVPLPWLLCQDVFPSCLLFQPYRAIAEAARVCFWGRQGEPPSSYSFKW